MAFIMDPIILFSKLQKLSSSGGLGLPIGFEFAEDGSLRLTGNATVWNDQLSNYFQEDSNTINYTLFSAVVNKKINYGIYDGSIWVKLSLAPNETKKIVFYKTNDSASSTLNNANVFLFYDDFSKQDNTLWNYTNSTVDTTNKYLKVKGGNSVYGAKTKVTFPTNIVVEWEMYSKNYDFDSGIKIGNVWCISDRGSGSHAISHAWYYPNGSQGVNEWNKYRVILEPNKTTFINLTKNKTVTSSSYVYDGGFSIQLVCDSDTSYNPLLVRNFVVYKHYNASDVTVSNVTEYEDRYEVEITSLASFPLDDIQIKIPSLPTNQYYITYINETSPVLTCKAFPPDVNSFINFYSQFNHSAKYDSTACFHLHTYIPPDATEGQVKLKLTWQIFPVQFIVNDDGSIISKPGSVSQKELTKIFNITEDMRGCHTLLNFSGIDTVKSISQIVFHKLERLGEDPEDTFGYEIPILYVDWHTENDGLGSQEEFLK